MNESIDIKESIITIIAIINSENIFYCRADEKNNFHKKINRFIIKNSDHLTKLNIFNYYIISKNKKDFCKTFNLNKKNLDNVVLVREQLKNILKFFKDGKKFTKFNLKSTNMNELIKNINIYEDLSLIKDKILDILKNGFFLNTIYLNKLGFYNIKGSNIKAYIHPESVCFLNKDRPSKIIYNSIVETKKCYLKDISEIF